MSELVCGLIGCESWLLGHCKVLITLLLTEAAAFAHPSLRHPSRAHAHHHLSKTAPSHTTPPLTPQIEFIDGRWHNLPSAPGIICRFNGWLMGRLMRTVEPLWSRGLWLVGDDSYVVKNGSSKDTNKAAE